jgi:hypothetical protein
VRVHKTTKGLSVHAIVGTHVVLFGFDVPKDRVPGLMGFAIKKTDHRSGKTDHLPNFLLFKVNDHGKKSDHSSRENPFQEFVWGDYTLAPERNYTYQVTARYGAPGKLTDGPQLTFDVTTESETDNVHGIYFNRGVAGSQRYAEKFHNQRPDKFGDEAFAWLSRGLLEGLLAFIARARGPNFGLRAAVYEFTFDPVLEALAAAAATDADVRVVFDSVDNATKKRPTPYPRDANKEAIKRTKLGHATPRTDTTIAHNKFVVLLENGKPTEVWTGSTNVTEGGLFGHWNVGHAVRDPKVAKQYLDFWKTLAKDPTPAAARKWTGSATPVPTAEPPHGITAIFSPRRGLGALNWYAKRMDATEGAHASVFLTGAFGVSRQLTAIFAHRKPYLRYLLLDQRKAKVKTIARNPRNQVTAGAYLGNSRLPWSNWLVERLTDLNNHVDFIHTKFMLINPLSDDPVVITGSANFSEPSTNANDENMLVIRGDTRVADIYLGEFMRLFTHFRFRGMTKTPAHKRAPGPGNPTPRRPGKRYLRETDAWARRFYVSGSPREQERRLFAGR